MFSFSGKEIIFAYVYAFISILSLTAMYLVSLIYPVKFLNILNIDNEFLAALWQALIIMAPIGFIENKCLQNVIFKK